MGRRDEEAGQKVRRPGVGNFLRRLRDSHPGTTATGIEGDSDVHIVPGITGTGSHDGELLMPIGILILGIGLLFCLWVSGLED